MKSLLLVGLTAFSTQLFAWGPIGHRVVAEIATRHLSPSAQNKLQKILLKDRLVDIANWPDHVRSDPHWKKADPWHYVNIPDGKNYAESEKNPNGDIITAIEQFTNDLKNPKLSREKRWEALAFITHLIGDFHMPLHVGRAEDKGGNALTVKWFGQEINLHHLWDETLIQAEQLSFTEYVDAIDKVEKEDGLEWEKAPLTSWVEENMNLRPLIYSFQQSGEKYWEYAYRFRTKEALNQQLLKGGYRLKAHLEKNL